MKSVHPRVLRLAGQRDMVVPLENVEQRRLFTWAKSEAIRIPGLALMYAIPNGGSRHHLEAANLKAEGVKSGVPDIHLPVERSYNSLYIELKRSAFALPDTDFTKWGTVSTQQLEWLDGLSRSGSYAVICRGCDHAKATILAYLAGDQDQLEKLNHWWVSMPEKKRASVTAKKQAKRAKRSTRGRRRSNG